MRCPAKNDPDIIHVSYKSASRRSTRLLLLEIVAEALLKEHQENIDNCYGEDRFFCECDICDKARKAMEIKHAK